jgi:hypothetical protein
MGKRLSPLLDDFLSKLMSVAVVSGSEQTRLLDIDPGCFRQLRRKRATP